VGDRYTLDAIRYRVKGDNIGGDYDTYRCFETLLAEVDRLTPLAEIGAAVSKISEYDTACLKFERQHRPNKVVEQWSIEAPDPCYYDGDCYEPIVSSYGVTLEDALTEAWLMENNND